MDRHVPLATDMLSLEDNFSEHHNTSHSLFYQLNIHSDDREQLSPPRLLAKLLVHIF